MNDIFISPLQNSKEYKDVINNIENNKGTLLINGLVQSQKPNIVYSIFNDLKKQILYIANTDLEAKKVYEDLCFYMKDKVDYLSSQDIYFYHLDAKDRNDEARKLKVLLRMISKENTVIVTSVEAVLSKYVPKEVLKKNIFTYKIGDTIDIEIYLKN